MATSKTKKKQKPKAKSKAKSKAKPRAIKKAKAAKPSKIKAQPKITEKLLTPLEDRLLIYVEGPSETTSGGIIIPGNATQRPTRGKVLAKGRGRRSKKGQLRPLDVNVGEFVLFPEFAGTPVTLDGEDLLILREDEVLGVVS